MDYRSAGRQLMRSISSELRSRLFPTSHSSTAPGTQLRLSAARTALVCCPILLYSAARTALVCCRACSDLLPVLH